MPTNRELSDAADALNSSRFFQSRRAAAVLKHAILAGYIAPFASMTGSTSTGNRVVLVDGYAGAGRYNDGSPGSPVLLLQEMDRLAASGRNVECLFIEQDAATFDQLADTLNREWPDSSWSAWSGSVEQYLDDLLELATDVPLFLFLDPFGLGLNFDVIADVFQQRPGGQYPPATEALIRIDSRAIWRIRGAFRSTTDYSARGAQLRRLDDAAGGTWWRDDDSDLSNEDYLDWFMTEYLSRICSTAGCYGWFTEVRQKNGQLPAYYLVFLTRHRDGMTKFHEALSLGQEKWRKAVFDQAVDAETDYLLWTPDEVFAHEERTLADQWLAHIEHNVRALLEERGAFVVAQHLEKVFGDALGLAREKHLRVVLRQLHAQGLTSSDSRGKLYTKRVALA